MAVKNAKRPCFVVADSQGLVWDGEKWVEGWSNGLQFNTPGSAYEDCEAAIEQAEVLTGVRGFHWYIQPEASPDMRLGVTRGFVRFPPVAALPPVPPNGAPGS